MILKSIQTKKRNQNAEDRNTNFDSWFDSVPKKQRYLHHKTGGEEDRPNALQALLSLI